MKALLQRVLNASVNVAGERVAAIDQGLLVFLAVEKKDTEAECDKLADRLLHYRLFSDEADKMNLNVQQVNGSLLVVSQFTLAANTQKGLRPGFEGAASPEVGKQLYGYFVQNLLARYPNIQTGCFGADMQVSLCNDGPVTFLLET